MRKVKVFKYKTEFIDGSPKSVRVLAGSGMFHQFGVFGDAENGLETMAIVEFENGKVDHFSLSMIEFVGKKNGPHT